MATHKHQGSVVRLGSDALALVPRENEIFTTVLVASLVLKGGHSAIGGELISDR